MVVTENRLHDPAADAHAAKAIGRRYEIEHDAMGCFEDEPNDLPAFDPRSPRIRDDEAQLVADV